MDKTYSGSWCPDTMFLAVPLSYLQVFPAQSKIPQYIQAGWTKVRISSAKWEEGDLKGKVGRGWPDIIHRCMSEQIGFGKEYTSNLGTNSLKFLCPGTPWKIFLYPQENAHPSQKYCTINTLSRLKISYEEEPFLSLFLTGHYEFLLKKGSISKCF